ncbi:MAG: sigma-70 family RNA polymerase sigma factor [Mariprofundaceae bacterium]
MSELIMNPESWLQEHGNYLYRYALSRLHDEERASDMLQDTLLAAWKGHHNFKGQSSLRTWLVGIMKHKIIDLIRKEIHTRKLSDGLEHDPTSRHFSDQGDWQRQPSAWVDNPENRCHDTQFRQRLYSCLSLLPEKQRMVFQSRELSGDDSTDICKTYDISPTHLHVLMHRARLNLQGCLQKHGFGGQKKS